MTSAPPRHGRIIRHDASVTERALQRANALPPLDQTTAPATPGSRSASSSGSPPIQPSDTANCFNNVAVAGGALLDGSGDLSSYHPVQGANPTWWEVIETGGTLQGTSGMCATVPNGPPAAHR